MRSVATVVPHAVGSGASLKLIDAANVLDATQQETRTSHDDDHAALPVLEEVDALQGLDVHALLAQLVGAVQALSAQLHSKDAQIAVLAKQNQEQAKQNPELGHRVAALEMVAARQ